MIYLTIIAALELLVIVAALFLVKAMLDDRARAETASAEERGELLQRIQAPEVAVMEHQLKGPIHMPQHVPMDDDEQYWESKEDLAARMMAEETNGAG